MIRLALGAFFLAFGAQSHGDTWTVGSPGAGADFDTLQGAIAAAMPGDLILVQAGEWGDDPATDGPILIDKSLTIIGEGSTASLIYTLENPGMGSDVPLQIRDLGPTDRVRIVGLGFPNPAEQSDLLSITDCEGAVVLSDVVISMGLIIQNFSPGTVMVLNSEQVTLDKCDFRCQDGALASLDSSSYSEGQSGLYALNSNLSINGCIIYGANTDYNPNFVTNGGDAIEAINSTLQLSGCNLRGGQGTLQRPDLANPNIAGDGGAALSAVGSQLVVSHGRLPSGASLLRGGESGGATLPVSASGGAAISVDAGSSLTLADDLMLVTGTDSDGNVGGALVQGPGAVLALPEALASLLATPAIASPGGSVSLQLSGEPGSTFVTYFSRGQGLGLQFGAIHGSVVLDLGSLGRLPAQVLDANGDGLSSLSVPLTPAVVGMSFLTQGLQRSPLGTLSLSPPSVVGIQ